MSKTDWIDVLSSSDLPTDDVISVSVGEKEIAIYTVGDAIYATANICTHGRARLCDGFLDGHEIECPLHQGKFDVRNGKPLCEPVAEALSCYPIKVEEGRVYLLVA